jgi:hypothetical protein
VSVAVTAAGTLLPSMKSYPLCTKAYSKST